MTKKLIEKFDPNMYWHVCTYAVTLMRWDYSKTIEVEVGGNVRGFDLIESAVETVYNELEGDDCAEVTLTSPKGETLLCCDDEGREDDWVKEMVVSVVLVKQERESSND